MQVSFNKKVKLIISDVDETIADNFIPTSSEMITELSSLLSEGKFLFLVSGSGLKSIQERVIHLIPKDLRKQILVSHCSGAEIVGYDKKGNKLNRSFLDVADMLSPSQKITWKKIIQDVISEFKLEPHPTVTVNEFKNLYGENPHAVMYEDRGPQITFEFLNSYNLTTDQIEKLRVQIPNFDMADLRIPVMKRAEELLEEKNIPITPRLGGIFALDFAIKGVSKTTAIRFALKDSKTRAALGITKNDLKTPEFFEIWGDKFSVLSGTDRHMTEALPKEVRSIDFRIENPDEFPEGYNVVLWDGEKHLHEGLLEYLQKR